MMSAEISPRRVLVIAYYFPPMGLSGVQRSLKFVKYLPKFGWHPTVLTVTPGGYFAKDESLLAELSPDIKIERTDPAGPGKLFAKREVVKLPSERSRKFFSRISDFFFIPDNKIGWRRRAVAKALELHKQTPFDLVFATAPPFTDFLIGADVKAKINKPLVFDYRDPWFDYPFKFYPTPLHKWKHYLLERRALRASSHVVTTNRRVKEALIERYPFLTYHDVDIVPQGYDPDDFKLNGGADRAPGKMRVTYAGIFWEDRVPDFFLRALSDLFQEKPGLRDKIEACFVGHFRDENIRTVEQLGLQESVRILGYLPHQECVRQLVASDVLWMIVGDEFGSPGKTYEYIGAGKPILGCAPEGFLKSTILEAGGRVVEPDDVAGIKNALADYHALYERNALKGPRADVVEKYSRVNLTGQLVKIFESLFEP
ncbi:MAG TPA: glycosyl transferase family 1 [Bacteroidetes bacterium]|jgi:glycosyltransferase involved in cell wall biosynthesis|nr:glycosyl transferase family 1 [Bacteroidota bacterium]